jgi:hypothetical protein
MTLGQNGDSIRYSLHMSSAVKNHAKDLHSQQAELGRGKAYIDAFPYILERLQREPMVLGQPSYALPALHLQVRRSGDCADNCRLLSARFSTAGFHSRSVTSVLSRRSSLVNARRSVVAAFPVTGNPPSVADSAQPRWSASESLHGHCHARRPAPHTGNSCRQ